jgi:hypothetical protein
VEGDLLSDPHATPWSAAIEVVDRLRQATPLAQTFSAGVALWHGTETSDQLVASADKALYQAKRAGRDQVLAADPPPVGRRHDLDPATMAGLAAADRPTTGWSGHRPPSDPTCSLTAEILPVGSSRFRGSGGQPPCGPGDRMQ